jgi:DNA helicase-2/ATP-dependent DNA helicase PcrA
MVETKLIMEEIKDEFQQIIEHIRNGDNFLLSGGAGSGKTYSLVQIIKRVIVDNPTSKIACMTYTNAAVKEIEKRVDHNNLTVSTIHDFLWDIIKHYQKELKSILIELINDDTVTTININRETPVFDDYFDNLDQNIQYKEYLRIREGIISHDELLIVANRMFSKYEKLCDILKDKYKFIFVDEYQDTNKQVVEIFLEHLNKSKKQNTIGFFGDSMQSIYDDSIGNLNNYKGIEEGKVKEVIKKQNRRNPRKVYELANLLRTDGLKQIHSDDKIAPNMISATEVKEGNIKFLYSTDGNLEKIKNHLDWNFDNSKETKELNLTHNLIAGKAGFRNLMDIYNSDRIIEYKNNLLRILKDREDVEILEEDTFGEVIIKIGLAFTPIISQFIALNKELYEEAKGYKFLLFKNIYLKSDILTDDKKQDEDDESKKGSKRDDLLKHLFKIQNNIHLYQKQKYNEFLRVSEFKINSIKDKETLKTYIEELVNVGEKTIEDIINDAHEKRICIIGDNLEKFKTEKAYAYNRVKRLKFSEFQNLYAYLEGHTPFSTQHKVKGDEFDNVLVILDNGRWNNFNFKNLFLNTGTPSVLERTQKIFYVCCTRAKNNLAVYYHNPDAAVITRAKGWFGDENVINIDSL